MRETRDRGRDERMRGEREFREGACVQHNDEFPQHGVFYNPRVYSYLCLADVRLSFIKYMKDGS